MKTPNTKDNQGRWIGRMFRNMIHDHIGGEEENSSDGTDLLEDFPTARRKSSDLTVLTATSNSTNSSFNNDEEEKYNISGNRPVSILSNRNTSSQTQKRVRISEDSTLMSYYKPSSGECKNLYYTKHDWKEFTQNIRTMTVSIVECIRCHQEDQQEETVSDSIEDILKEKPPSPRHLPPDCLPEEIIGIEHLLKEKHVMKAMMNLRRSHSRAVLREWFRQREHRRCRRYLQNQHKEDDIEDEKELDDLLAEASMRYSSVSSNIALHRAAHVADMD